LRTAAQLVQYLIELGVDLSAQNNTGETAMLVAVLHEQTDAIVDMLCREGTDPGLAAANGISPIDKVTKKRFGTIRKGRKDLIDYGPTLRRRFGPIFVEQQFFGLNAARQELRMQQIVTAHRVHQEPAQRLLLGGIQFFNNLSDDDKYNHMNSLCTIVYATRRCNDPANLYVRALCSAEQRPATLDTILGAAASGIVSQSKSPTSSFSSLSPSSLTTIRT